MRVKLLQCGDIHLDAPFTSISGAAGKPQQRRQDLKDALARIVALADAENVDLLLVCGDFYEHGYTRKSTIYYACDLFSKIPGISVLMIPGNHDPYVPGSYYSDFEWPSNVHILKDNNCFYEHPACKTRVYGGFPPPAKPDCSMINILMHHGTLDMPFAKDAFKPVAGEEINTFGFDYCALGHFHSCVGGAGPGKNIYNAGSPEPLGFDEEGDHGVFIAVIDKETGNSSNVRADFVKLNRRRFINIDVQVGGCLTNEQVASVVAVEMGRAGCAEDIFRISLSGYLAHDFKIDVELVADLLRMKAFYMRIDDRTVPDYDFDQIAREPGLKGLFAAKMLARAANAANEEERHLVMQALYYGMEAIDEGKVCI